MGELLLRKEALVRSLNQNAKLEFSGGYIQALADILNLDFEDTQ